MKAKHLLSRDWVKFRQNRKINGLTSHVCDELFWEVSYKENNLDFFQGELNYNNHHLNSYYGNNDSDLAPSYIKEFLDSEYASNMKDFLKSLEQEDEVFDNDDN